MDDRSSAETIFFAALEKTEITERAAFLNEACAGDQVLRRRVESLLAAHADVGEFLERPIDCVATLDGPSDSATELSFLDATPEPNSLGRLDHYEVLEVVGRGGTGMVLRAYDTKLHRVVALKVLAASLAASRSARQRFAREARAAAAVRDDHVVAIHSVEDREVAPYLVMEFIDGLSLEALIRRDAPLPVAEILRIGIQAASGLAAAHAEGLVHRDIKPANILLEKGMTRVKISDFGLARAADDVSLTQTGLIAGMPLYMAPEQAAGEAIDYRADLFSFGSVLYEMCTGRPAFKAANTVAVIRRVCDENPQPIREINAEIADSLCRLIDRLLAKRPAERPASAKEVVDQLTRLAAGLGYDEPSIGASVALPRLAWGAAAAAIVLAVGFVLAEANGLTDFGSLPSWLASEPPPGKAAGEPGGEVAISAGPVAASNLASPIAAEVWERSVAGLPKEQKVKAVEERLRELNPNFRGGIEFSFQGEKVFLLICLGNNLTELSPVRALQDLEYLECGAGNEAPPANLRDLTPIQSLKLRRLSIASTLVTDLMPIRDMPLEYLILYRSWVSDLTPLSGMTSLKSLALDSTSVTNLEPIRNLRLETITMKNTAIEDLSPLQDHPLTSIVCEFRPERDAKILRAIPSLRVINGKTVAEFWKEVDGQ